VINAISTGALCGELDAAVYTITIDVAVDAGTPILPVTTVNNCATGTALALNTLITGETTGGIWTWNVSPSNPLGGTFVATPGSFNPIGASPGGFSFTYNISNGACVDAQTVILNVVNCPILIVATDDAGITDGNVTTAGDAITIAILANDIYPPTVTPTITVTTPATDINGTVTFDPVNGTITFTPNPNFFGVQVIEYFISDPITGASSIATISIAVINPVSVSIELSSFVGLSRCETNEISWTTMTESNTQAFDIYRSGDGISYVQIGTMAAAGNSSVAKSYSFVDNQVSAAQVYYRLTLRNMDGTSENTGIVGVNNDCKNNIEITNLRPNPVSDLLYFDVMCNVDERVNLVVMDVTGRIVTQQESQLVKGRNSLTYPTSNLSAALYFIGLRKTNGEQIVFKKFTKIND
jgi:hypothetical protein